MWIGGRKEQAREGPAGRHGRGVPRFGAAGWLGRRKSHPAYVHRRVPPSRTCRCATLLDPGRGSAGGVTGALPPIKHPPPSSQVPVANSVDAKRALPSSHTRPGWDGSCTTDRPRMALHSNNSLSN